MRLHTRAMGSHLQPNTKSHEVLYHGWDLDDLALTLRVQNTADETLGGERRSGFGESFGDWEMVSLSTS